MGEGPWKAICTIRLSSFFAGFLLCITATGILIWLVEGEEHSRGFVLLTFSMLCW